MKRFLLLIQLCILPVLGLTQTDTTKRTKGDAMMIAYQLYERIVHGHEPFEEVAKKHSEDPGSAPNGGLYENIEKGAFVPKFEETLFKLKPGEISRPFRTSYGYHIIQLIKAENNKYTCRHILIQYEGSGW